MDYIEYGQEEENYDRGISQFEDDSRITALREVIKDNAKCYCGRWMWANHITGERRTFYCNSPKCEKPECKIAWARKRIAIVDGLIRKYKLNRFFTLTVDRSEEQRKAWSDISYWWSILRKRFAR